MEEQRVMGFRRRPRFAEVMQCIEEGEPLNFPLPKRNATSYVNSHYYLDDLPQSTEPWTKTPGFTAAWRLR